MATFGLEEKEREKVCFLDFYLVRDCCCYNWAKSVSSKYLCYCSGNFCSPSRPHDKSRSFLAGVDINSWCHGRQGPLARLDEVGGRGGKLEKVGDVGGGKVVHFVVQNDPGRWRHDARSESEQKFF